MSESPEDKPDIIFLVKEYISTRVELFKLTAIEQATGIGAGLATGAFIAFTSLFALVFGSAALGFWLGSLLNSYGLGFAIVMLIYLILAVIMVFVKSKVEKRLVDLMVKKVFSKKK